MRIVLVYQHFIITGVGSTKAYDLARHLVSAGHQVTVICGRGYLSQGIDVPRGLLTRLRVEGVDVLCLGVDYRQKMGFIRRLAAFASFTLLAMVLAFVLPRYDVLLASSTPLTVGLVGLVCRYVRRIPYVFEVRDLWPEVPYEAGYLRSRSLFRLSTFFEEWFYREAAAVCAISQKMCRRLIKRGIPAGKVHFVPTGVNLDTYDVQADQEFRKRHGLEGCFASVYVGAHGRVNGLDYLVDAAGHLTEDDNIRIVVVGDGSEKPRLIAEAKRRGLEGRRILFLPPVPRCEVPRILKTCDAMLMINTSGPGMQYLMTNKFFDYLAAGRPIVANVRAELTDWILQTGCGIFVKPDQPEDLIRALHRLKADPDGASRMGRQGRHLATKQFDRLKSHHKWQNILSQVAAQR